MDSSEMDKSVYCPYLGREILFEQASKEHIIPLALGGANTFAVMVDKEFNSTVGSEIDGALANDFLVEMKRQEYDAIGHSKKKPSASVKNAKMMASGKPIQVSFDPKVGMTIWDSVARRHLSEHEVAGQSLSLQISIPRWNRLRFAAKAALAAGYFLYADLFVRDVEHQELREIMNHLGNDSAEWSKSIRTRVYDQFSGPDATDRTEFQVQQLLCKLIHGSCVIAIPGPRNIGFTVGVLGQMVGTLNVPARTEGFPKDGNHDLGHVVALRNRRMFRSSYRELIRHAYDRIGRQAAS